MRLVELRASEVVIRNTKFGQKILITASGDLKSEIKIWRPLSDPVAQEIKANEFFTAAVDSLGKYSPIANPVEPTQEPSNSLAVIPKPTQTIEAKLVTPTIHPHVAKLAQIMAQCVAAIKSEIPNLDPESEQKYAVSLFIQASREIF